MNASRFRKGTKLPDDDGIGGTRLMIRVAFGKKGALGPGKVRLLEMIGEHGSVSAAARAMGMSYRRAWLLVQSLKEALREPVVATQHGGNKGGGAGLTPFGRDLVKRYRAIERAARKAVDKELAEMTKDLTPPEVRRQRSTRSGD